jgi:glycosyltransferase involved in cell wall biosynthesis
VPSVANATGHTRPLRVARIIARLNIGGPAIQAIEMSARLEAHGCHTLLVHGQLGPDEGDMRYLVPANHAFEIAFVPALRRELAPHADAAAVGAIFRLLSRFRPDIVHTHTAKAGAVGRAAALLYNATVGRRAPAQLVHTYHGHVLDGYFSGTTTHAFAAIERTLGRRTDALIAVSPTVRRQLLELHGIGTADRFHVVPLGFDLSSFASIGAADRAAARHQLALDGNAQVAAFVGRLTAIKQPELFVEAADRLARADARAHFLIAGGGELETALRESVAQRGLANRIRFLGWQRDLQPIYAATDVVAITSRNEGTPVALIESMAAGVPGVCFDVGGVRDVISTSDLGVLVPPDDVEAMNRATRALFDDRERREAMGAHARASVTARFAVERLAADLLRLYRDLVGSRIFH